jgi:CDGSH-type Zn-finger protein
MVSIYFAIFELKKIKSTMSKTKLIINSNGSIKIEGDFEIMDCDGKVYGLEGRTALGLCRCGLSSNKPFVMVRTVAILIMNLRPLICRQ